MAAPEAVQQVDIMVPFLLDPDQIAAEATDFFGGQAWETAREINRKLMDHELNRDHLEDYYDITPPPRFALSPMDWTEYAHRFENFGCLDTAFVFYSRAIMYAQMDLAPLPADPPRYNPVPVYFRYDRAVLTDTLEEATDGIRRLSQGYNDRYKHHLANPAEWGANVDFMDSLRRIVRINPRDSFPVTPMYSVEIPGNENRKEHEKLNIYFQNYFGKDDTQTTFVYVIKGSAADFLARYSAANVIDSFLVNYDNFEPILFKPWNEKAARNKDADHASQYLQLGEGAVDLRNLNETYREALASYTKYKPVIDLILQNQFSDF